MRIAEIATLLRPVPPDGEGSVESVVSTITEGLVARGHDVTLFALRGSRTAAELRSPVEASYTADPEKWDWQLYEAWQVREAFRSWREFDILHCHSYHHGLLVCDYVQTPSLHTIHIDPGPDYVFLARRTRNRHLLFCSRYQARAFEGVDGVHIVPHGMDMSAYEPAPAGARGNYLAFLGRFIEEKGPLEAIALARRTGLPLKLAAPANAYYHEKIEPLVDGRLIEYVGELGGRRKAEFLARARALVYPVQRGEPFGLVLIEAMASGLPVVALNRGAVPEVVTHGVTGWLCETVEEMADAVARADALDRRAIRREAVERFAADRMIDRIEGVMREIVEARRPASAGARS